jgi:23S rRNA pseudouridine1911/1915/1917 synthase
MNAGNSPGRLRESNNPGEKLLNVIFEGDGWLVINKPAGLVCHPTKQDERSSLIGRIRLHFGGAGVTKPHMINRLDRETSGIILVASNPALAGELGKIWETRAVEKSYLALVHGHLPQSHGIIDVPLGKDEHSLVAIKDCVRPDGAMARTEFHVERRFTRPEGDFSLLKIVPHTGRKHQIRVHLAHFGHPLVGDKLYGGDEQIYLAFVERRLTADQRRPLILPNHALHACGVRFIWRGQRVEFHCEPEPWFSEFLNLSGGPQGCA